MFNRRKLLLILAMLSVTCISTNATDLKQVDVSKSSNNAVDVTLYTTGSSANPMVTRKSANTYVILMPSVGGKNAGTPDLGAVKDMVTDVSIKNVEDGMSGYTKITFTTTKPLNIQTHIKRTTPITQEEKEAKTVIANAQATIKPVSKPSTQKTAILKNEVKETKNMVTKSDTKEVKNIVKTKIKEPVKIKPASKPSTQKTTTQKTAIVKNEVKETKKVVTKSDTKEVKNTVKTKIKEPVKTKSAKIKTVKHKTENKTVVPTKQKVEAPIAVKAKPVKTVTKSTTTITSAVNTSQGVSKNIPTSVAVQPVQSVQPIKTTQQPVKSNKSGNILLLTGLLAVGIIFIRKNLKNILKPQQLANTTANDTPSTETEQNETYDNVANNENLSWQEKYKHFNEKSKKDKSDDTTQYTFTVPGVTYNKADEKRLEFERTLEKVPEIYKPQELELTEDKAEEVSSEDITISKDMNTVKLKSFTNPISLNTAHRNRYKKILPKEEPFKEGKFVQLHETALNKTSRGFKDANLSVAELVETGNKYIDKKTIINTDYSMSSLEEYIGLLDKYSNMPSRKTLQNQSSSNMHTTPVAKYINPLLAKKQTQDYLNGLIVKSSYDIDEHKSFHLVSLDGQNALVGRIDENVSVLKRFDRDVNNLRVKPDKDNVYIVQVGNFKSVIGIENNKMGVLIEL